MLSFLAYIARGFAPTLRDHKDVIPTIIVRLLSRCPPEGAPARKELLVAIRHILSTELRQAFLPYLETLMDENLLLGDGYTAFYVFRPAAYSMLADLIHHVRLDLPAQLVGRVILMYSRALHDPTLPNGIQTMSIKLLLNLVDVIVSDRFTTDLRRSYLLRILTALLQKFDWLQKVAKELINRRRAVANSAVSFDERQFDLFFDDPLKARPIPTDNVALDPSRDNIRDLRFQLKTLINGVKNLFLALRATPLPSGKTFTGGREDPPGGGRLEYVRHADMKADPGSFNSQPSSISGPHSSNAAMTTTTANAALPISNSGFTAEEGEQLLVKLFRDGILCFDLFLLKFSAEDSAPGSLYSPATLQNSSSSTIPPDEKDLMDQFGYVFTLLEPSIFHDVISSNMDFLIDRTKENIVLVSVPQYFLAISGISRGFAAILARHLMDRFEEIGSKNTLSGAIILRLFKLLFLAVSVYPEENESVLQPYLAEIILNCFKYYPRSHNAINYFMLLRSLFRSIGGGRFDTLYKEVLPLLQTILDELTHLSPGTSERNLRDIYVELCLTTPVRLSNLLPYLSYLMKPVLLALQSGTDLVNQGLRTFELCIDNLTPDFLEPILAPVFTDILSCLWGMIKPAPANQLHSHTAVRLLGKLGGKSRRFLTIPPVYNVRKSTGVGISYDFHLDLLPVKTIHINCDSITRTAMVTLNSLSCDIYTRQQALVFLKRAIVTILAHHGIDEYLYTFSENLEQDLISQATSSEVSQIDQEFILSLARKKARGLNITTNMVRNTSDELEGGGGPQYYSGASKQLLCEIVCALFDSLLQPELHAEVSEFLMVFYRLVLFFSISNQDHKIMSCLDFDLLCDIILEYITCPNEKQSSFGWTIIFSLYDQYCLYIPDREVQYEMKIFFFVADKAISACFRTNTMQRIAACRMISKLCDLDLSIRFYWHHEIRLIRGVLYVMKSLPAGSNTRYSEELTTVVYKVLRLANRLDENMIQTDEFMAQRRQYFDQVMLALVTELSNPNSIVRDAVKASFQLLSDIQGCEVTDLLIPLKARVCGPIFSKPLRALPLHVQVGYIDAITYCFSLRPPLLEINDELIRLINEALAVIESEDQALTSRSNQLYNSTNLVNLRSVCIKLLSTCLSGAEFQQQKLHPLRNQIVSVFFKTLYARQPELVEVSRAALEQVMAQQHKLPTDLLQNGLRPVLQSLGEPRNLNLAAVEGLRRILQLFSHFFKAEIGKKLLDYLYAWAGQQQQSGDASSLAAKTVPPSSVSPSPFPDGHDLKVITAITELFCLLPSCGQMFMSELFFVVRDLESVIKRRSSSPFRPILLRFMEIYPQEAVLFFMDKILDQSIMMLFCSLIMQPNASKVVSELGKAFDVLSQAFSSKDPAVNIEIRIYYLSILRHFYVKSAGLPESLIEAHVDFIEKLWQFLEARQSDAPNELENSLAKLVSDITMAFVLSNPGQVKCAFLLLKVFAIQFVFDFTDLPSFYRGWLKKCTPPQLKAIMNHWQEIFVNPKLNFAIKGRCTRLIILPLVSEMHKINETDLDMIMDEDTFVNIDKIMWHRDCRNCSGGSCVIAVEELQFTVLIMNVMRERWQQRLERYQKRIFNFLLNRIRSLDCSVRYSALYVLALTLIESRAPAGDVFLVFTSLLKSPTADIRAILKQSFDLLLPMLMRQKQEITSQVIENLSQSLTKDGYLITLVLSLWQSINSNHTDLLPISPSLIIPLTFSFCRCSPMGFAAPDSRQVPIELAETILSWHNELKKALKSPIDAKPYLADLIINSLIRLLCSIPDYNLDSGIFERGLVVLESYLVQFNSSNYGLRLGGLDRLLAIDAQEEHIPMITSGLKILKVIVNKRSYHVLCNDLPLYEKWLRVMVDRASGKLIELFQQIMSSLFEKIQMIEVQPAVIEDFKEQLCTAIIESLNSERNTSACFAVLRADAHQVLPAELMLPAFLKAFQHEVRDYLMKQESSSGGSGGGNAVESHSLQLQISQTLIPGIQLGVLNIRHAELSRSSFLGSLQTIWEHATSPSLLEVLFQQMLIWIKSSDPVPSMREKVEVLLTPCKVDQVGDPKLLGLYLDIVYEVYSKSTYAKTELRSRLEGSFLRGLWHEDVVCRQKFLDLLDASIPRNVSSRLCHIFETQRWELAGSHYWMPVAAELLLKSTVELKPVAGPSATSGLKETRSKDSTGYIFDFFKNLRQFSTKDHVRNMCFIASLDNMSCHGLWISLLPAVWRELGPELHTYLNGRFIKMLSNDSFLCQARMRPSVIKSMVEAISQCSPLPAVPSFLIAYVMRTYCCWYSGSVYLEKMFEKLPVEINPSEVATKEQPWMELVSVMGAMYRDLGETDYMFGAYRRGFLLNDSNTALSFDQMDLWVPSQKLTESAMSKCRAGTIPFSDSEFSVWEERWVSCAKRLQQWDLLTDISRAEVDAELGLECLWRLADWGSSETHSAAANLLKSCTEPNSRLKFFESFLIISQSKEQPERLNGFQATVEDALQLSLHEWQSLPTHPCPAHSQLLHNFQMLVEIQESLTLYSSLGNSMQSNLARPQFMADLKGLLTAWRERLPNAWDDMNFWSDILAWRQHVFTTINLAFQAFIPDASSPSGGSNPAPPGSSSTSHPFAFRGYHEMAWIINRFAHIARKNHMTDVCLSFLNRIYTLPNIEIQDAFLKLREQAKCYMDNPAELPTALEVVNATNLNYFSGLQKGEFFALRSIILARLGMVDEANRVFAQAVQIDLNMGHGWAAWGRFNDQRFSQNQDINFAVNAINCYLQAATLFKAHKSRRFLARILWLLTFEDSSGSLGKSFEMYNHELPTWFWVCFVPQLLSSLVRKEQRQARFVLIKIAKNYPQALYLPLRTFHEECRIQHGSRSNTRANSISSATNLFGASQVGDHGGASAVNGSMGNNGITGSAGETARPQPLSQEYQPSASPNGGSNNGGVAGTEGQNGELSSVQPRKHPLESAEDLLSILKTGYPLLALTMENAMEHIVHRLRSTVDEDFYRVLTSLIGEAYQHIMNRISGHGSSANQTISLMEASLRRVFTMICNSASLAPLVSLPAHPSLTLSLVQSRI